MIRAVPWVNGNDGLSGFGLDKLVVDEQTPGLCVLASIGRGQLNEEVVRHVCSVTVKVDKGKRRC